MPKKLYPKIKPYKSGRLDVGDGHKIYYELCGNPKGKPVLYLHGGPGSGVSPDARRFFNPRKYNVVLFDQRGAGKSTPFATLQNNTTWKLVGDINRLLNHLGIKKVCIFGGSWGSTLALVYAIKNPHRVAGMVLRGIWLCEKEDNEYYIGGGVSNFFPEAYERFISNVPKRLRRNAGSILGYYAQKMKSKNKKVRSKFIYEWARYEMSIFRLNMTEKAIKESMKDGHYKSLSPLESYYVKNMCFLPDNFILKNALRLRKIPVTIVHGRYDMICRPILAWKLHKALPRSKLYFTISGHGSSDGNMKEKLVEEMDRMYNLL